MGCSGSVQEEVCYRAMGTKALDQLMTLNNPHKPFMGRKQVNFIAENRPDTQDEFMAMSLHGMSSNLRRTHGDHIMEALKQASHSLQHQCFTQFSSQAVCAVWFALRQLC